MLQGSGFRKIVCVEGSRIVEFQALRFVLGGRGCRAVGLGSTAGFRGEELRSLVSFGLLGSA